MYLQLSGFCGYNVQLDINKKVEFYSIQQRQQYLRYYQDVAYQALAYQSCFIVKQTYNKLQLKKTFTLHVSNYYNIANKQNADVAVYRTYSARYRQEQYKIEFFIYQTQLGLLTLLCFNLPVKLQLHIQLIVQLQDISSSCLYAVFLQVLDALLLLYNNLVQTIRNYISQQEAVSLVCCAVTYISKAYK